MYQKSGLAEIVAEPSAVTFDYLQKWFRANSSFGKGLDLLKIPHKKIDSSLLKIVDGELVTDLKVEQEILYSNTILGYKNDKDQYILKIDKTKLLSLLKILGTARLVWAQSKFLFNYQNTYDLARTLVEEISLKIPEGKSAIEKSLSNQVWPRVIAVDYLGEFVYHSLFDNKKEEEKAKLLSSLQKRISPDDWYTKAILAWENYKEKKIDAKEFLEKYSIAAGNDYELTRPRFFELAKAKKPPIPDIKLKEMKVKSLEDLYVGLQYLRSESKHKSLFWISSLRDSL